jgi:UDP-glucose 4-epimerase
LHFVPVVNKAYGGIKYAKSLSDVEGVNYVVVPFEEGMRRTVAKDN